MDCELDCCFRMWRWNTIPNKILTDVPPPEDELGEPDGVGVCDANKASFESEVEFGSEHSGVPVDCPIYQGDVGTPPW